MQSVMSHNFSMIPQAEIQRSSFDRSHGLKTTFDSGYLIPIYVDEALPGDTFNLNLNAFARLTTPIKPVMDNLFMDFFFFAVPNRLIWSNFKKFMGEQANPGDSTSYLVPQMTAPNFGAGGIAIGSLSDYMGLPTGALNASNTGIKFNSLWHRSYNLIWNEWFRDENLQNSVTVDLGDGPDTYSNYVLLKRGKRHDYFTSALPWPQKGSAVNIPLGTEAPIYGKNMPFDDTASGNNKVNITNALGSGAAIKGLGISGTNVIGFSTQTNNGQLFADLTNATAATINSLRQAFQLQKLYERDARGGTRYTELIRSHFGVISPDARQQRPEYLGGGSIPINFHPIAQTTAQSSPTLKDAQGNLAAFATSGTNSVGFTKSFTEHCTLIGLVSVRADLTYQQGINKMFFRRTKYDFYWPALSHLGEQTILNKEIYAQGEGVAADEQVFGYQERYAEYRYKPSQITGKFRSTASGTLDYWHLSQKFTSLPTLGNTFIQETPPVDRIVAVNTEPQFYYDSYIKLVCARPMPVYSVPGLIDHF